MADKKQKHQQDAASMLRKLKKGEILEQIQATKNPYLIAAMIELESRGKNVSKRRRDDIMTTLKKRLEVLGKEMNAQVLMTQYLEDTDEGYGVNTENRNNDEDEDNTKSEESQNNF